MGLISSNFSEIMSRTDEMQNHRHIYRFLVAKNFYFLIWNSIAGSTNHTPFWMKLWLLIGPLA